MKYIPLTEYHWPENKSNVLDDSTAYVWHVKTLCA